MVVANGENIAGGFGLTLDSVHELFDHGVDVITSGNHIWDQQEVVTFIDGDLPVLRPLNYPSGAPGRGFLVWKNVLVVNLLGRVFMQTVDCPFRAMDRLLGELNPRPNVIIVDMHAEATSEMGAMGWYLDGKVSAVLGTHTHVGTIDTRVLPKGTAFVSDVGMVGPMNSVIGTNVEDVLYRFLTQRPRRLNVATGGPLRFNSVLVEVDPATGTATSIQRVDRELEA